MHAEPTYSIGLYAVWIIRHCFGVWFVDILLLAIHTATEQQVIFW